MTNAVLSEPFLQTEETEAPEPAKPVAPSADALLLQMYVSAESFRLGDFLDSLSR